ncbi:hypothetical protein PH210_25415 [Paenibacillus sp. BSR1-1]|uniref:hypothetical protein n=1 Tax=Paenibacillus sp. BSR1-1 TaxID=3020845 RepID=UPI0025B18080|nr:hypothetical protein [Paenibacillus sp. BSR1-1]MDN3019507.1 hypothetical protein [Paenibacillus sp. BSR1-1]
MKRNILWEILPIIVFVLFFLSQQKDSISGIVITKVILFSIFLGSLVGYVIFAINKYFLKKVI